MTEYLYFSSDAPFDPTKYVDKFEGHYFEVNRDEETGELFSFSSHFTSCDCQMMCMDVTNPLGSPIIVSSPQYALWQFIQQHFEETNASYLEYLPCLNSYENLPLKKHRVVKVEDLEPSDLYYQDNYLLIITKH